MVTIMIMIMEMMMMMILNANFCNLVLLEFLLFLARVQLFLIPDSAACR